MALMCPHLVDSRGVPEKYREYYCSFEEFRDGLVLDRQGTDWFDGTQLPIDEALLIDANRVSTAQYKANPTSKDASALWWDNHKGQPKTYLQVTGADALRDESLIYEHVLREQGVQTKLDVYPGLPHCAQDFFPMHSSSGKAVADLKAGVEWILKEGE